MRWVTEQIIEYPSENNRNRTYALRAVWYRFVYCVLSRVLLGGDHAYFEGALTYKFEWDAELERRKNASITRLAAPLPHPDHIILDMRDGTMRMTGPMTIEKNAIDDARTARKPQIRAAVAGLKLDLELEDDPAKRASIIKHIDIGENLLARITKEIPDEGKWNDRLWRSVETTGSNRTCPSAAICTETDPLPANLG